MCKSGETKHMVCINAKRKQKKAKDKKAVGQFDQAFGGGEGQSHDQCGIHHIIA